MVKSISAEFLNAQRKHGIEYYYTINLYRRYWNGSAYVYEGSATDLKQYLKSIGNIIWKLDTEALNTWRVANFDIELKNQYNRFEEGDIGYFPSPYIRYKSKIEIKIGYKLADGTTEVVYIFTGLINKDCRSNIKNETIVMPLMGREIQLEEANAEDVTQTVTSESLGTGNDSTTIFYTDNYAVGEVTAVYEDGVELTEDTDYTVSNLNEFEGYAAITFNTAPATGRALTIDYKHWYRNEKIGTIIGYLLDEADFPAGQRTIDSDLSDTGQKTKTWNTQADFEATEIRSRNIDTTSTPGDVIVKEEDLDVDTATKNNIKINGTYPTQTAELIQVGWANKYLCNDLPAAATPAWTRTVVGGYNDLGTEEINPAGILHSIVNNIDTYVTYQKNVKVSTVQIKIKMTQAGQVAHFTLELYNGSRWCQLRIIYQSGAWSVNFPDGSVVSGYTPDFSDYIDFWVCLDDDGNAKLYADGVLIKTTSSCPVSAEEKIIFYYFSFHTFSGTMDYKIDYIYDAPTYVEYTTDMEDKTGILTSNGLDYGTSPPIYGDIIMDWTDPADGSTLVMETQSSGTSDFSSDNDSWRTVSFTGDVGTIHADTVKKRYFRWRITIVAAVLTSPTLNEVVMPAHMLSEIIDCSTSITIFDSMTTTKADNNGAVAVYSRSSEDASTWEAEAVVTGTTITSTVNRYIQFRNILNMAQTFGTSPAIQQQVFVRTQNVFTIKQANFTGMTVKDAIEELARVLDYEIGTDTEGKYFFRQRNTDTSIDLELSAGQEAHGTPSNILKIDNFSSGWDRIRNRIVIDWGIFSATITPESQGDASPTSTEKYGVQTLVLEGTTIEIDAELDTATDLATIYYNRYKDPKKIMRLKCKMLSQLELSDTVNCNFLIAPWLWWWGKTDEYYGKTSIWWFDAASIPVADILATVIGIEIDVMNWFMYITVKEI